MGILKTSGLFIILFMKHCEVYLLFERSKELIILKFDLLALLTDLCILVFLTTEKKNLF